MIGWWVGGAHVKHGGTNDFVMYCFLVSDWHFDCHCLALKADRQRAGVFNFESEDTILITCQSKGNHALNDLFFSLFFL